MDTLEKTVASTNAGGGAGKPPVAPVASGPAGGEGRTAAAQPSVAPSAAQFGGNPTGRRLTAFKHPANTPEGIEERRLADAARKQAARAVAAKMVEPPPLPSAGAPLAGTTPAPGSAVGFGQGAGLAPLETPPVLWQPEMLATITDKLLSAAEENRVGRFVARCQEAGLLPKLIQEIEADASFPTAAKALLKDSLPRLACKWLNRFGVSAEFRDELACVTAILLIVKNDKRTAARLDELIAMKKVELKKQEAATATAAATPLEVGK